MNVDNGSRLPFIIQGVFEGTAGVSRGMVAFTPNRVGRRASIARAGLLDGEPVMLTDVQLAEDGRSFVARYELLA